MNKHLKLLLLVVTATAVLAFACVASYCLCRYFFGIVDLEERVGSCETRIELLEGP